jgi:phosphoglycolate phosphatase-like HAD superfamily hydrolase
VSAGIDRRESPGARVAVFDVDGTLTATTGVDAECYGVAVEAHLGQPISTRWSDYADVTDSGILRTIWEHHTRRGPTPEEQDAVTHTFVELLTHEWRRAPEKFRPIDGARSVFVRLRKAGWSVAMATGGWAESARLKLAWAGIPFDGVPLATSSEATSRRAIVRLALSRVKGVTVDRSTRVVLLGDGEWDVRTAAQLGRPFVGVGAEEAAARLKALGSDVVLPDYTRTNVVLDALRDAGVPALARPEV